MRKEASGLPDHLAKHAAQRSQIVRTRLQRTMKDIEDELERNDNIYPHNGGRLSQAEVCRRAGVEQVTLQGPAHKETTRVEVNSWLALKVQHTITGAVAVRKEVTSRADYWKEAHAAIANRYHVDQLKTEQLEARLKDVIEENERLRKRIEQLRPD